MNYRNFKEQLLLAVETEAAGKAQVHIEQMQKNNGVLKECVVLRCSASQMSPVIYLDDLYEQSRNQYVDFHELAKSLMSCCNHDVGGMGEQIAYFYEYEKAKNHILVRLINRQMNDDLLKKIPYEPCLDLALVCYLRLCHETAGEGTAQIDHMQLERWGITKETLFADAVENTLAKYPPSLMNLNDMLEKLGQGMDTPLPDNLYDEKLPMYVLTNNENTYGACVLFYPGLLEQTAEVLDSSYYILPSSIHETILLPDSGYYDPYELKTMVMSVNKTQMDPKDVLSDAVYYYDRTQDKVFIIP